MRGAQPLSWPQAVIVLALIAAICVLGIAHVITGDIVAVALTAVVAFVTGAGVVHNGQVGSIDEAFRRIRELESTSPIEHDLRPRRHV